ncbi:MAG: enolase C-terminal domain-like protein [Pirellulaceae bacterium]|nr:hypothetical protein [Planctomycetaceae bacterium]
MITFDFHKVRIPFRFSYGHAKKRHSELEAIIVIATDSDGVQGYGEAVPRTYVTGETCESILHIAPTLARQALAGGEDQAAVQHCLGEIANQPSDTVPSCALCAIDTALLCLEANRQGTSVAKMLGGELPCELVYSASIGLGNKAAMLATLLSYRAAGIQHFKVKVGGESDFRRIKWIRRILGADITLFADANAKWGREEAVRNIEQLAKLGVWALEEPLRTADPPETIHGFLNRRLVLDDEHWKTYQWLRDRSAIPLIADESLICPQTARNIIDYKAFDILNVRLSKCGGTHLSGEMIQIARTAGLGFSCCAMVGETAILATVGSHFATAFADHKLVQGHSHRVLHRTRFVRGEPAMKRGGKLRVEQVSGLGLQLDTDGLEKVTVSHERITT